MSWLGDGSAYTPNFGNLLSVLDREVLLDGTRLDGRSGVPLL